MHEQDKLAEANHFLERMAQSPEPKIFGFELSAFLSAARTALQYALEEAKKKPGGQAWYDGQIVASAGAKFFKDKRDVNIHSRPVRPETSVNIALTDTICFSESVHVQVRNDKGEVIQEFITEHKPAAPPPPQPPITSYSYTFPDWPGADKDVVTLCKSYWKEIQTIVLDGEAKGFLTA